MVKQILILAVFAIFSTSALADNHLMTERQLQQCMGYTNDLADFERYQSRSADKINNLKHRLRSLKSALDNLDFQYNLAENLYRGCRSNGWSNCDQQARNLDFYGQKFNSTLDEYNRIGRIEERAVEQHNDQNKDWARLENRYNRQCVNVDIKTDILIKHCANSSNDYCKRFK